MSVISQRWTRGWGRSTATLGVGSVQSLSLQCALDSIHHIFTVPFVGLGFFARLEQDLFFSFYLSLAWRLYWESPQLFVLFRFFFFFFIELFSAWLVFLFWPIWGAAAPPQTRDLRRAEPTQKKNSKIPQFRLQQGEEPHQKPNRLPAAVNSFLLPSQRERRAVTLFSSWLHSELGVKRKVVFFFLCFPVILFC